MEIYYVEFEMGCGLHLAVSESDARRMVREEYGRSAGRIIAHLATEDEIAWVRGMGGHVPERTKALPA